MKTIQIKQQHFYQPNNKSTQPPKRNTALLVKLRINDQITSCDFEQPRSTFSSPEDSNHSYTDNGSYNSLKSVESCLHIPMISGSQADHD